MTGHQLRILQVSTADIGGGAEKVAWNLFETYQQHSFDSWLAVGYKRSDNPEVFVIPNDGYRGQWAKAWVSISGNIAALGKASRTPRASGILSRGLDWIGQPTRLFKIQQGHEDFDFPGTWQILNLPPKRPDVLHLHNLHGGYFDLRALPWLSQQLPIVLTLHDAWLLSGHCAHSFDCEHWKTGCGDCPDLTIYPAIRRDATGFNWQRKKDIYARSRLYIATPSKWLMQKVEQAILTTAMIEARIIPNGVNLSVFQPADKEFVRSALGLLPGTKVLVFASLGIRRNIWKDYQTMRSAVASVAERMAGHRLLFLALGEDAPTEQVGQAQIRFIPYKEDASLVAFYYQAADVYLHAANVESWGLTITEALACGTPVVATSVGGIREQIDDGVNGFLVPPGDARAMAARVEQLLNDDQLRRNMSTLAVESARKRFDVDMQARRYLEWFIEILDKQQERYAGGLLRYDKR